MSLDVAPFVELRELSARLETGEFVCATPNVEIHVHLQRGRVAWATSSREPSEFAKHIKRHAHIDDDTFRDVVEDCRRERRPLGATLVALGLASLDQIRAALAHQARLALGTLAELGRGRTLFLERKTYAQYSPDLTVGLVSVFPEAPQAATPDGADRGPLPPAWGAQKLLDAIGGAEWVEVLDQRKLVDAAPPAGRGAPRVPESLVAVTLGDGADFAAVRAIAGSVVGARVQGGAGVWCKLGADATLGTAISALLSLPQRSRPPEVACPPPHETTTSWQIGAASSEAAEEIRQLMSRASEILAVVVLANGEEPIVGVGGSRIAPAPCVDLCRRRARILALPILQDDAPDSSLRVNTGGYTLRAVVTGERDWWCFGAELDGASKTVWMLTERGLVPGVGWACLTALARGLSRADVAARARSA